MGKRRIRSLHKLGYPSIVGADSRPDRRTEVESHYGIRTFASAGEALAVALPDAVIISVPPQAHHQMMRLALDRRLGFFVEASVLTDGMKEIRQEAARIGVVAAPSATLVFHPAIEMVRQLIANGRVGKVSNVIFHSGQYLPDWHTYEQVSDFYVSKRETGGAREIVPFELTWLTKLLGFPKRVCGNVRKTIAIAGAELIDDTYNLLLDYGSALSTVTVDVVSRHATRQLVINGDGGQIVWNWDQPIVRVFDGEAKSWSELPYNVGSAAALYSQNIGEDMYVRELEAFLGAVQGRRQFPNTLAADHRVLDLLYAFEQADAAGTYVPIHPVTAILVTARCSSTRLPRKHFAQIEGRPAISYLLQRLQTEFRHDIANGRVIVAIAAPDDQENRAFEEFRSPDTEIVYGAADNVPARHLQVADALGADYLVAVDGDDLFTSMKKTRAVIQGLESGHSYVVTSGLPLGMNPFGYSRAALQRALGSFGESLLDTGWTHVFDGTPVFTIGEAASNLDGLRFTLDYPEDLEFTGAVVRALGERVFTAQDSEIIECVQSGRLSDMNAAVTEHYWENFNRLRDAQLAAAKKVVE